VAFLHSHNVIHCDLKSDNIFLDEDGMLAKVGDLGLAMQRDHATMYLSSIKSAAGTSMYMAPEVMRDEQYGRAADTYSYALVLYELLLHKRPYSPRFRKFSGQPPPTSPHPRRGPLAPVSCTQTPGSEAQLRVQSQIFFRRSRTAPACRMCDRSVVLDMYICRSKLIWTNRNYQHEGDA
jgi:serine/threonine protein kinase